MVEIKKRRVPDEDCRQYNGTDGAYLRLVRISKLNDGKAEIVAKVESFNREAV